MAFSFIPKEIKFFDLFDKQASNIIMASNVFCEIIQKGIFDEVTVQRMKDIEHTCDEAAHDIIEKLNRTFITPFDREDIHALAYELDDVVDMLNTIISRLRLYKLNVIDKDLIEFSELIRESVNFLAKALNGLRNQKETKDIRNCCIEINRLENEGDQLRDKVLMKLFDNTKDPVFIIKWKEIYEESETVLDICEDVANVIESILVKQG
jgi:uncharacterized protein